MRPQQLPPSHLKKDRSTYHPVGAILLLVILLSTLGAASCGSQDETVEVTDPCAARTLDYFEDGLDALAAAKTADDRTTYAGLLTLGYGHLDRDTLSDAQRRDLDRMLGAVEAGEAGALTPAEVASAIEASKRFAAGLTC